MGLRDCSQVFGIHELYRPAQEPTEVDIVAVHGLNGDALKTWTAQPGNVCWLNHPDFLPQYVKRARVLTWGYNANITSLTGRKTSSGSILQHAQTLVAQLYADRDALAYSAMRDSSKLSHLHSIHTCTYGILFFGTPHHGSSKARLLSSLQKMASLTIPKRAAQFEGNLIKALEEESEILQEVTDQFVPLMVNFRIFFFWEQEKTDIKYTKDYIVDETSAAPIVDDTERCGIGADHRAMVRFDKNTSQGFRTAVATLRRYSQEAPPEIRGRWGRTTETLNETRRHEATEMQESMQSSPENPPTIESPPSYHRKIEKRTLLDKTFSFK